MAGSNNSAVNKGKDRAEGEVQKTNRFAELLHLLLDYLVAIST